MLQLGKEIMGAAGLGKADLTKLVANTEALADKCRINPVLDMGWKKPVVPEASIIGIDADPPMIELTQRCEAGITRRFPGINGDAEEHLRSRLEHELGIIGRLGFASYFLTVAEVSRMILDMGGVRVAARGGSGASSLVNYLIDISQVDPIRHDLIFERFLSGRRSTLPDIDIDVESAERHNVYRKIFDRFGAERVTLMSMQNGYRHVVPFGMQAWPWECLTKKWVRLPSNCGDSLHVSSAKPWWRSPSCAILPGAWSGGCHGGEPAVGFVGGSHRKAGSAAPAYLHASLWSDFGRCNTPGPNSRSAQRFGPAHEPVRQTRHGPMGMLKLDVLGVRMQSAMAFAVREVIRLHPSKAEVVAAGRHPVEPGGAGPDYIAPPDGRIDLNAVPFDDEPPMS